MISRKGAALAGARRAARIGPLRAAGLALLVAWLPPLCEAKPAPKAQEAAAVPIGELTPFYRGMQVQGHVPAHGLMPIPGYLTGAGGDVRYRKNPRLTSEIPFADTFSVNRVLGGYKTEMLKQTGQWDPKLGQASADYVIREADGRLRNRPEIIANHLRPYLEAGYALSDITINLENIPWGIALNGGEAGLFGQRNPPGRMDDWKWAMERLAQDIKDLYGPAAPGFKIGNEFDTRKSFDGSAEQYLDLYVASYAILRSAFPESRIAPGEFTRDGKCENRDVCVYDTKDFLAQAKRLAAAPSYVPRSLHAFQDRPQAMPSETVQRAVDSYARLGEVAVEIHQFGLLGQPFGAFREFGSDQGSRRAAWEFEVLMGLQERLRPKRVFHWGGFFAFPRSDVALLNGTGFLRLMLDRYLGARTFRLALTPRSADGAELAAVGFEKPTGRAIVAASFTAAERDDGSAKATLDLRGFLPPGEDLAGWRFIRFGRTDSVFAAIRRDLQADGNLKPEFDRCPSCTAEPGRIAIDAGQARRLVTAHRSKYERIITDGLRWRPLTELTSLDVERESRTWRLTLPMNELLILESPGLSE